MSDFLPGRRTAITGLLASAAALPFGARLSPLWAAPLEPAALSPADYSQGMGGTDEHGLVRSFPLRATGARQFFVDSAAGSTRFNGLSPYPGLRLNGGGSASQVGATGPGKGDTAYGPAKSIAQVLDAIAPPDNGRDGEGWQVLLAEGQRLGLGHIRYNWSYLRGHSVAHPFCLQSYDPRDPLNLLKQGRAGTSGQGDRPELYLDGGDWPYISRGDAAPYDNWVFRGLKFVNLTDRLQSLGSAYRASNMLIENCIFDGVQLSLQNDNPHPGFDINDNVIVRRTVSFGQFDVTGAHACGIFSRHANITVEDCVFYHNGWKVGVDRNTPVSAGGPDIFKHCLYLSNGKETLSTVRRVLMIDGSAAGLSLRGDHLCHHNVIVDCPTPDFSGGGSVSDTESPSGVLQQGYGQLVLGGSDINLQTPRGQGFSASDAKQGSYYSHNLFVNNPCFGHVNNQWLQVLANAPVQPTYLRVTGNRAFGFAPASRRLNIGGRFPENVHVLDQNNVLSEKSPCSTHQLYAMMGYRDKDALIRDAITDPMKNWAQLFLAAAGRAFAFDFSWQPPS